MSNVIVSEDPLNNLWGRGKMGANVPPIFFFYLRIMLLPELIRCK